MALSSELKPEVEAALRDSTYDWALMQRVSHAVGLDVVRDSPEIYTDGMTLYRANVSPISLHVVYTQDGINIADPLTWAKGVSTSSVYYVRFNLGTGAQLSHGWVDGVSRQLVQSG